MTFHYIMQKHFHYLYIKMIRKLREIQAKWLNICFSVLFYNGINDIRYISIPGPRHHPRIRQHWHGNIVGDHVPRLHRWPGQPVNCIELGVQSVWRSIPPGRGSNYIHMVDDVAEVVAAVVVAAVVAAAEVVVAVVVYTAVVTTYI